MPVARKVWQPILTRMPSSAARRWIMRHASTRFIGLLGQCAGAAGGGAEEGCLAGVANAGRLYIGVEIGLQIVMGRHFMTLAAFFVQPKPPALALRVKILHAHVGDGADTAEGVDHDGDERAIAEADEGLRLDGFEELRASAPLNTGVFPRFADAWARGRRRPDSCGGRLDDQVIAQHADRGQVLLDRGLRHHVAARFSI